MPLTSSASLLTDYELCSRKGYYSQKWQPERLLPSRIVQMSLEQALIAKEGHPWGEIAGAEVLQLCADRGLETDASNLYDSGMHHAAMADIMVSAIRKETDAPWLVPERVRDWSSGCLMAPEGLTLRRTVLVSNWSDERHYSECRNWHTMGEIAHYNIPMQLVVLVIGQQRNGKRHGPWTQGFLHPSGNHQLRFRKKSRSTSEVFAESWQKIAREDHDEIPREKWLQAMLTDDVLRDVCFKVDVPVPEETHRQRIIDTAARQLERLHSLKEVPSVQFSTCDRPPCAFRKMCHVLPERAPAEKYGFVRITPPSGRV